MEVIPYTLIAGLFLSNFPEALSSSVGMESQGTTKTRIMWLWLSQVFVSATGAAIGFAVGESLSHTSVVAIEGMAAGAMLTMIGAAMLPEAAHRGGANLAGVSSLLGFLSAIAFKLLE
jgi:zinc transporter ZupT